MKKDILDKCLDVGLAICVVGLALGIITTSMYWKHCKK